MPKKREGLFYKRGEGDVTNDGGSTDGHNAERDS